MSSRVGQTKDVGWETGARRTFLSPRPPLGPPKGQPGLGASLGRMRISASKRDRSSELQRDDESNQNHIFGKTHPFGLATIAVGPTKMTRPEGQAPCQGLKLPAPGDARDQAAVGHEFRV